MTRIVKLSSKCQIVIPRQMIQQLDLRAGDGLLVEVRGKAIVLVPRSRSYTARLRGLHKEVWQGVEAKAYMREERKGWR